MFQLCLRFEKLFSIENKKNSFSFLAQQIWDLAQDKKNPSILLWLLMNQKSVHLLSPMNLSLIYGLLLMILKMDE